MLQPSFSKVLLDPNCIKSEIKPLVQKPLVIFKKQTIIKLWYNMLDVVNIENEIIKRIDFKYSHYTYIKD